MPTCDILLAAYNGTKYGPALLDSLLAQTYRDYRLIVRDDGSKDNTVAMLKSYQGKFEGRMRLIEGGEPTGSALGNYTILLQASAADYVLCADIDDVWLPSKVADTLEVLQKAEEKYSPATPIYVFTDVIPVDAELRPLANGYWKFKRIDPVVSQNLNQSLVCASMLGCASGMNRALVSLSNPVPQTVTGHDWWALLVAVALGHVEYCEKKTMLYRLHGSNHSMQKKVSLIEYYRRSNKIGAVRRGMSRRRDQARALLERFETRLAPPQRRILAKFIATEYESFVGRRVSLLAGGYLYPDLTRNIAMLAGV